MLSCCFKTDKSLDGTHEYEIHKPGMGENNRAAVGSGDAVAATSSGVNKLGSAPRCNSKHDKSFRKQSMRGD